MITSDDTLAIYFTEYEIDPLYRELDRVLQGCGELSTFAHKYPRLAELRSIVRSKVMGVGE